MELAEVDDSNAVSHDFGSEDYVIEEDTMESEEVIVLEPVMVNGSYLTCKLKNSHIDLVCTGDISQKGLYKITFADVNGKIAHTISAIEDGSIAIVFSRQADQNSLSIEPEVETELELDPTVNPDTELEPDSSLEPEAESELDSNEKEKNSCSSIPYGTWVMVPGDPEYGTSDFCLMKYEAKCSLVDGQGCTGSTSDEIPTSAAAGSPWVNISQQDAMTECASLGSGYHLMTNEEWMTVASNVATTGLNWSNGIVGDSEMAKGHSDNNPASACPADPNDTNAYVETNCSTRSSTGIFNQRRTHYLSDGQIIWDLAGNVREWTSYLNINDKPTPTSNGQLFYTEYDNVLGTATMPLTDLIPQIAIDNTWNSSQSIGMYSPRSNGLGGSLTRGGNKQDNRIAGVFASDLHYSTTTTRDFIGFRCSFSFP